MYMDEKFSITGIATGLVAIVTFYIVANNLGSWNFTDAETVQTILIAGFMALWGVNQVATNIENWFFQVGTYIIAKYPEWANKPKTN